MSPVWTPAELPPVLDKFCDLSLDAQRVMAAVYSDFHQKKAEMMAAYAQSAGIKSYINSLYFKFYLLLIDFFLRADTDTLITET